MSLIVFTQNLYIEVPTLSTSECNHRDKVLKRVMAGFTVTGVLIKKMNRQWAYMQRGMNHVKRQQEGTLPAEERAQGKPNL